MALLSILRYPDPRLHKVAQPVQAFDARLQTVIDDMFETMYDAKGIGLAATQVDVHERLIVIDVSEERDQPLVLINPEITWASAERVRGDEGCLSVPGLWHKTPRYEFARVIGQNLAGDQIELSGTGLMAQMLQHECDHLDGYVYIDRLEGDERRAAMKNLRATDWFLR